MDPSYLQLNMNLPLENEIPDMYEVQTQVSEELLQPSDFPPETKKTGRRAPVAVRIRGLTSDQRTALAVSVYKGHPLPADEPVRTTNREKDLPQSLESIPPKDRASYTPEPGQIMELFRCNRELRCLFKVVFGCGGYCRAAYEYLVLANGANGMPLYSFAQRRSLIRDFVVRQIAAAYPDEMTSEGREHRRRD